MRFLQVLLFVVIGFVVAAAASYFLIGKLSGNPHDRSVESAMTSIFVFGPLGAVVAGVVAWFRSAP